MINEEKFREQIENAYQIHIMAVRRYYLRYNNLDLSYLPLTVRAFNCLKRAGYNNINDIKDLGSEELINIRNIGNRCYNEIAFYLNELFDRDLSYKQHNVPDFQQNKTRNITDTEEIKYELKKMICMILKDRPSYCTDKTDPIEANAVDYKD